MQFWPCNLQLLEGKSPSTCVLVFLKALLPWPRMYGNVQEFVKTCVACQKLSAGPKLEPPGKSEWRPKLFESISMDWITALPESKQGNTCLLVAVDEHSQFPWPHPASECTANKVCQFLMGLFGLIGIPRYIKTDNAACFKGGLISSSLRNLGIRQGEIPPIIPRVMALSRG